MIFNYTKEPGNIIRCLFSSQNEKEANHIFKLGGYFTIRRMDKGCDLQLLINEDNFDQVKKMCHATRINDFPRTFLDLQTRAASAPLDLHPNQEITEQHLTAQLEEQNTHLMMLEGRILFMHKQLRRPASADQETSLLPTPNQPNDAFSPVPESEDEDANDNPISNMRP